VGHIEERKTVKQKEWGTNSLPSAGKLRSPDETRLGAKKGEQHRVFNRESGSGNDLVGLGTNGKKPRKKGGVHYSGGRWDGLGEKSTDPRPEVKRKKRRI